MTRALFLTIPLLAACVHTPPPCDAPWPRTCEERRDVSQDRPFSANRSIPQPVAPTMAKGSRMHAAMEHPIVMMERGRGGEPNLETRADGTANAILTPNGGRGGMGVGAIAHGWQVRRLTPVECERLQAFPDGFTRIPYRNKPAEACPDGPRYKALGNSWAVNCAEWIGERMAVIDRWEAA